MTTSVPAASLTHLRMAVTDSGSGTATVRAPAARNPALVLKADHGARFWCTTQAGGCGGRLDLVAGAKVRPYFRHRPGDAGSCALALDPTRAERCYEHLRYQHALVSWLSAQGLTASVERTLHEGGRADLHVVVNDVSHSIEVQLSPIADQHWADRDARYHRSVDHVTWLYGPNAETGAARQEALRGVALLIHGDVDIGVRGCLGQAWSPLGACHLDPEGFWTPDLGAALTAHETAQREAQEAAERHAAAHAERDRLARERAEQRRPGREQQRGGTNEGSGQRRAVPGSTAAPPWVSYQAAIGTWRTAHPEARGWETARRWDFLARLDSETAEAARFITYLMTQIYGSGPTTMFALPDVKDLPQILDALQDARIIGLSMNAGVPRWNRAALGLP